MNPLVLGSFLVFSCELRKGTVDYSYLQKTTVCMLWPIAYSYGLLRIVLIYRGICISLLDLHELERWRGTGEVETGTCATAIRARQGAGRSREQHAAAAPQLTVRDPAALEASLEPRQKRPPQPAVRIQEDCGSHARRLASWP